MKNNTQRNIKIWAVCPGQRQIKNVGINLPTAVWLNRPLEKHTYYLKHEGQMLFGLEHMVPIKLNTAMPVCLKCGSSNGWSIQLPIPTISCTASQKKMPKTNDMSCFPHSAVIGFLPSPAFQNPQARWDWITFVWLFVRYLHKSSSVNWSLWYSDLNVVFILDLVAHTLKAPA